MADRSRSAPTLDIIAENTFIFRVESNVARHPSNNYSYVGPDGLAVADFRQAARFTLINDQAVSGGAVISHTIGQTTAPFMVSPTRGEITTFFWLEALCLVWETPISLSSTVIFCQFTNGTVNSVFDGNIPDGCSEVQLFGETRTQSLEI